MKKLTSLWTEAGSPVDRLMALVVYGLVAIVATATGKAIFEIITNPSQFNNASFGIFDTLG